MGRARRSRQLGLRDSLAAANQVRTDLQEDRQLEGGAATTRATKLESTVRYLGIEVDDALSISEQVEL